MIKKCKVDKSLKFEDLLKELGGKKKEKEGKRKRKGKGKNYSSSFLTGNYSRIKDVFFVTDR